MNERKEEKERNNFIEREKMKKTGEKVNIKNKYK